MARRRGIICPVIYMKDYIKIVALVLFDQLVKIAVRATMDVGQTIPVIKDVLHFTYVRNDGAAWNSFSGQTLVIVVVPILAIIIALFYFEKNRKAAHWSLYWSMILIVAGGVGNLIDRVLMGYVTDIIDFRFFPVFNIADIAVCVGCGLLLLHVIFFDKSDSEKKVSNGN